MTEEEVEEFIETEENEKKNIEAMGPVATALEALRDKWNKTEGLSIECNIDGNNASFSIQSRIDTEIISIYVIAEGTEFWIESHCLSNRAASTGDEQLKKYETAEDLVQAVLIRIVSYASVLHA